MSLNKTTTSGLTNLARTFYHDKLLMILRSNLVYDNLTTKDGYGVIEEMFGPIIQWTRMTDLPEAKTIAEGGDSTGELLSAEVVTASLVQKAQKVKITDLLHGQTLIKKINNTLELMGRSAAKTVDSMIRRKLIYGAYRETSVGVDLDAYSVMSNVSHSALTGGTTTATSYTNGGVTYYHLPFLSLSNTTIRPVNILPTLINGGTPETVPANFTTDAMQLTIGKLLYGAKYLKQQNVPLFPDGYYRCVIGTEDAYFISRDPELVAWGSYAGNGLNGKIEYLNGELGAIGKIRIFESTQADSAMFVHPANNSYFSADVANSAWTPTVTTITGWGCCTMVDHKAKEIGNSGEQALKNISLAMIGFKPDKADPHGTYMLISYKIYAAVGILDTRCGVNLLQFYSRNGHA